jgi:hypothetical protein
VPDLDAVSLPLESPDALRWGGRVRSISGGGLSLLLCYPFKPGSCLAVNLLVPQLAGDLLVKVIHIADQKDGTWLLGCEFMEPLSEAALEAMR